MISKVRPLISVSLATFNSRATVRRTITSVLAQSVGDFELLISDAGSSDDTLEIVFGYAREDNRIRVLLHSERRPWVSLTSHAIHEAKGTYFCVIDSDDFVSNNYFRPLVDAIERTDAIAAMPQLVHCDLQGRYVSSHSSSCRNFNFAAKSSSSRRLAGMVATPDTHGAVNLVYSLWRTPIIRSIDLWAAKGERLDDDYFFVLRALEVGKILQVRSTWICRTLPKAEGSGTITSDTAVEELTCDRKLSLNDLNLPFLRQILRFIKRYPSKMWLLCIVVPRMFGVGVALLTSLFFPAKRS